MAKLTDEIGANRLAWVTALEGGYYHQTNGMLRETAVDDVSLYCCLGVACNISKLGKWGREDLDEESHYFMVDSEEINEGDLSATMMQWLGMTKKQMDNAVAMNDEDGRSFREIAAHFRKLWRIED